MSVSNDTFTASDQSAAPAEKGSIVLLAAVIAVIRAALVVIGALSFGSAARYIFPEMFAIPHNPVVLLAAVTFDTFAVSAIALVARSKNAAKTR